jgi:hypothetical protein
MADDDGFYRRYLVEGIVDAVIVCLLLLLQGNPKSGLPDRTMSAHSVSLSWGHRFLSSCWMVEIRGCLVSVVWHGGVSVTDVP